MKEFDKLTTTKSDRDGEIDAYKRGYREGVDVTMWAAIFMIGGLLTGAYWLNLI